MPSKDEVSITSEHRALVESYSFLLIKSRHVTIESTDNFKLIVSYVCRYLHCLVHEREESSSNESAGSFHLLHDNH